MWFTSPLHSLIGETGHHHDIEVSKVAIGNGVFPASRGTHRCDELNILNVPESQFCTIIPAMASVKHINTETAL